MKETLLLLFLLLTNNNNPFIHLDNNNNNNNLKDLLWGVITHDRKTILNNLITFS